jgi:hypothetical protein
LEDYRKTVKHFASTLLCAIIGKMMMDDVSWTGDRINEELRSNMAKEFPRWERKVAKVEKCDPCG